MTANWLDYDGRISSLYKVIMHSSRYLLRKALAVGTSNWPPKLVTWIIPDYDLIENSSAPSKMFQKEK